MGRVRGNNEDNFKLAPELNVFVLSDGMGGEAHGEVASKIAVEGVVTHFLEAKKNPSLPMAMPARPDVSPPTNRLLSAVMHANRTIYEQATQNKSQKGMGATVVAVAIEDQRMSLVHVGDSRAYLLRAGELQQLTQDHSLVAEQVRRGVLTQQQADESKMQSVLIRALGIEQEVEIDADEHLLMDGDTLVLCSDGLSRMVTEPEVASTILTTLEIQAAADRLVQLANDYGGQDNITVILIRVVLRSDRLLARMWRWLNEPLD